MTATSHTHGEERRYHYGNHRQNTRQSAPSPRGGGSGAPMKKADAFFMGTRGGGSKHPASAANTIYIHLSALPVCKPNHTPTNMTATSHTRRRTSLPLRQPSPKHPPFGSLPCRTKPAAGEGWGGGERYCPRAQMAIFHVCCPHPCPPPWREGAYRRISILQFTTQITSNRFISNLFHYTYT